MVRDLDRVISYLEEPAPASATTDTAKTDGVAYWQSYDPRAEGATITAASIETADRYASPAALVRGLDETLRRCIERAGAEDPGRILHTRLTTIRLDEFLKTRVLEIGVHGLDLADALGRDPWLTGAAGTVILEILRGLLGDDPSSSLGWSDLVFIETGTGRRALTDGRANLPRPPRGRIPAPRMTPHELDRIRAEVVACRACPRLVAWREAGRARQGRAVRATRTYWGRPVPGFGDPRRGVLILGLAPAAHGGNRTGRIFTGDRSGDFLFASLHRSGSRTSRRRSRATTACASSAPMSPPWSAARRRRTSRRRRSATRACRSWSESSRLLASSA